MPNGDKTARTRKKKKKKQGELKSGVARHATMGPYSATQPDDWQGRLHSHLADQTDGTTGIHSGKNAKIIAALASHSSEQNGNRWDDWDRKTGRARCYSECEVQA